MNRLPNVSIKLFGREYDLGFGQSAEGGTWLFLVNRQTNDVLPATAIEGRAGPPLEVNVYDVEGIVPALEAAGIVERKGPSQPSLGLKVSRCEIIHPELAKRLASMERENTCEQVRDDGRSR